MALATEAPFPQYFDKDGDPLDSGSLFFGVANQNPEISPVTVYWDLAGTQPAAQPIRTLNGYAVRNGSPALVFAVGDYSITVRNRKGEIVYFAPNSVEFSVQAQITQLRNDLAAVAGSDLVGYSATVSYSPGTMGIARKNIGVSVGDHPYSAVGDGITDDTVAWAAALSSGAKLVMGAPGKIYKTSGLTIPADTAVDLRGSTMLASGVAQVFTAGGNNVKVRNGIIDCANTQGATTVNSDGAVAGVYANGKSNLLVENVKFTRFRDGVLITSNVAGVYSRDHKISRCSFDTYVWDDAFPDSLQRGIYAGASVTAENTIIGTFGPQWAEALLVSGVTVSQCYFRGGQYGTAFHRCSDFSFVGNHVEETSRGISIQHQSRDFTVSANTFQDNHTTDIHCSSGARNGAIFGNVCNGVHAADNTGIQAYYGCEDIEIFGNKLDSRFDQWAGGATGDTRAPSVAIRTGQKCRGIKIHHNKIKGYLIGVDVQTTIYPSVITPADPNYQNSGVRAIDVHDNDITFAYEQLVAAGFKAQFLQSNSYALRIEKSLAAESLAAGAWGLNDVRAYSNRATDTQFAIVWGYVADTSGSPVVKTKLRSWKNISDSGVGTNNEIFTGTMVAADVESHDNSWRTLLTWTPVIAGDTTPGTQTYSVQMGRYKVNDGKCQAWGRVVMTAKDGATAGSLNITGLPFTAANVSNLNAAVSVSIWGNFTLPANYTYLSAQVLSNTATIRLTRSGSGVATAFVAAGELNATSQIDFCVEYPIA